MKAPVQILSTRVPRSTARRSASSSSAGKGRGASGPSAGLPGVDAEPVVVDRGQRNQVRPFQPLQPAGRGDGEVVVRAHRRRLAGDHGQLVGRQPVVGPVDAEHLANGAELEREEAVDDHHGDVAQHDPVCQTDWQDVI